ncbi:wiskott-Aldrich syndrome protein family member 3b isoform X2 [Amia ocellicauda]|uniref:wiskott-Aldrich syndrome protein family member 3b isoform X2 n=1 Tax=Amia ocellicauda TaxID=2972642 RepID=UPI003464B903|nr:WASF3 protein [Amia calva]
MPLVKRNIEPRPLCRGTLPEGISSELECVTNNTLSSIIRQLSSLSKHAEDIFGELFNEANHFYLRANSLQDRIDRLAVKVTQLDSTVEEVSLQDINMRKAFKSSTVQDQQVVSKNSIPNPVVEMYSQSDKPPPLSILSPYRDDKKDGLKFYTDPSYFFDLWKEKMLQDTEDKRKEKRRQKEQKRVDGTTREVKKVRKARNRRQEWNIMAFDKELRPDHRLSQNAGHGASSEGSLSPDSRSHGSDLTEYSYPATPNHSALHHHQHHHGLAHTLPPTLPHHYLAAEAQSHLLGTASGLEHDYRTLGHRQGTLSRPQQPPPPPPPTDTALTHNGGLPPPPVEYSMSTAHMMEYYGSGGPPPPPPAPLIPSAQTAFATPLGGPIPPTPHGGPMAGVAGYAPPLQQSSGALVAPPPPGPPPPPPPSFAHSPKHGTLPSATPEGKRHEGTQPVNDARSDLLAAIRMGIQLKKVQEQQEQQAKREPVGNDVATILSRRIAVEYSDSDDSELEDNEWSD